MLVSLSKKYNILFLFIFLSSLLYGQNNYLFTRYTSNEGLAGTTARCSYQDSRGYIWIGTPSGLSRFDGHHFTNYTILDGLTDNIILAIAEDPHHHIWISTGKGINKFDGKKFYELPGLETDAKDFAFIGDTTFVATRDGLYVYYQDQLLYTNKGENNLMSKKITALLKLNEHEILIGTNKGISLYKDGAFSDWWKPEEGSYVMSIIKDQEKDIWFCTLDEEVYCYKNKKLKRIEYNKEFSHGVSELYLNHDGDLLLVNTDHLKIFRNGKHIGEINNIIENDNSITDLMQDNEGNYWISTNYGQLVGKKTSVKKFNKGESMWDLYLSKYDQQLYVLGAEHIYKTDNDSLIEIFKDKPEQAGELYMMAQIGKDEFLFGASLGGLIHYKNKRYTFITDENATIACSAQRDHEVLIGGRGGTFIRWNNDSLTSYDLTLPDDLFVNTFSIEYLTPEKIFLATNQGLFLFYKGEIKPVALPPEIKKQKIIRTIKKARNGSYFLGSRGYGLINVSVINDTLKLNYIINSKNASINDHIVDITEDDANHIWLTAANGVYKISGVNTPSQQIEYLGIEDGLPANSWTVSKILFNRNDKNIYVAGSNGLAIFPQTISFKLPVTQRTHLTQIEVQGKKFDWNSDSTLTFEGLPSSYSFTHQQNAITFYFTGINFYKPERVRYQYMLEGLDEKWSSSVSGNFITYNNLQPGHYVFKVRSGSGLSLENEAVTTFPFVINPPFWQLLWFRILVLVAICAIIYLIYQYRLNAQIKKQQIAFNISKQLNESKIMAFQARMNPHFVFNSLNSIQYFISNNDKLSSLNYLSKFAKLLRQILDNSMQTKITLENEINMLRSYIEMEELRFEHQFSYSLEIPNNLDTAGIEIPGMIIQPFIENAIIHGLLHKEKDQKGFLKVSFLRQHNQIVCVIEDNGIGRERSLELNRQKYKGHRSHGTTIAMNRLEMLNSEKELNNTIEFIDLTDDHSKALGTRVTIKIPILNSKC